MGIYIYVCVCICVYVCVCAQEFPMAWNDIYGPMEGSFPAEVLTLEDIVEEIIQEETVEKSALSWGKNLQQS